MYENRSGKIAPPPHYYYSILKDQTRLLFDQKRHLDCSFLQVFLALNDLIGSRSGRVLRKCTVEFLGGGEQSRDDDDRSVGGSGAKKEETKEKRIERQATVPATGGWWDATWGDAGRGRRPVGGGRVRPRVGRRASAPRAGPAGASAGPARRRHRRRRRRRSAANRCAASGPPLRGVPLSTRADPAAGNPLRPLPNGSHRK